MLKTSLRHARILIIGFGLSFLVASPAFAVTTCQALTLYGNAAVTGLCKTLSPGTQNLWVCGLTDANPDVHSTFNRTTPLHITVRTTGVCEGASVLAGAWPNALTLGVAQPVNICNVNVQNYVARFNAVPQTYGCQASFVQAQALGRITPAIATSYIDLCNDPALNCP